MKIFPVDTRLDGDVYRAVYCESPLKSGDFCESTAKVKVYVECCDVLMNVCKLHRNTVEEAIPDCKRIREAN